LRLIAVAGFERRLRGAKFVGVHRRLLLVGS
jgi:hypothetical protein